MQANTHVNNLVGSSSTMVDGWTIDITVGTAFPPVANPPIGDFKLLNCVGNDFWFGLKPPPSTDTALIRTTLNGCGRARLDYGNCQNLFSNPGSDSVHVTLNGNEISSAVNDGNEVSKTIEFDFTDGNILELNEDGPSAIRFNSLTILSCCAS